jgi:hypothetical protein
VTPSVAQRNTLQVAEIVRVHKRPAMWPCCHHHVVSLVLSHAVHAVAPDPCDCPFCQKRVSCVNINPHHPPHTLLKTGLLCSHPITHHPPHTPGGPAIHDTTGGSHHHVGWDHCTPSSTSSTSSRKRKRTTNSSSSSSSSVWRCSWGRRSSRWIASAHCTGATAAAAAGAAGGTATSSGSCGGSSCGFRATAGGATAAAAAGAAACWATGGPHSPVCSPAEGSTLQW